MFDSIFIGSSGLQAFSSGLKVISNNVANLNTPGFKSADAQFASLYYQGGNSGGSLFGSNNLLFGSGVMAGQTFLNFQQGDARQTGNPLDVSVNGNGFFMSRKPEGGEVTFTRAGQFEFNKDGSLVVRGTDRLVIGLGTNGDQSPISLNGLRINAPKATSTVNMVGNLSSSATEVTVGSVKVIDAIGGEHILRLILKPKPAAAGTWTVSVLDDATEVATGEITFAAGRPVAGSDSLTFDYAPNGVSASPIKLDFSKDVTSFETGNSSSLAVAKTDGYAVGSITKIAFEADGTMSLTYSNGEVTKGPKLALATFEATANLTPLGNNEFTYASREGVRVGLANQGEFGAIASSQIEGSNVDLATEFSDLIVAQRGYQASSRIVSTANDMLQDLYDMKGHR
jgi:flagellar hook protein FlgE